METEPDDASADAIDYGILQEHVGFQLHISLRALRQTLRAHGSREKKSAPSGTTSVLTLLDLNPGLSQQQIADCLFLDASNVAIIIRLLHNEGYVAKRRSDVDRRRHELHLTDRGRIRLQEVRAFIDRQEERIARGMSKAECDQLIRLLQKFQSTMR